MKNNEQLALEASKTKQIALELEQSNRKQKIFIDLIGLALKSLPLEKQLQAFIEQITSLAELGLLDKGAIFTIEDDPNVF